MVKTVIAVAILTLMLSSGFVIVTYDRADEGVKILSDDDYVEMEYSEPTYKDGSKIEWEESIEQVQTKDSIGKEEWNNIFKDYRDGKISKQEASNLIRSVKI